MFLVPVPRNVFVHLVVLIRRIRLPDSCTERSFLPHVWNITGDGSGRERGLLQSHWINWRNVINPAEDEEQTKKKRASCKARRASLDGRLNCGIIDWGLCRSH